MSVPLLLLFGLPAAASDEGLLVVDLIDGTSLAEAQELSGLPLRWANPRSEDESLAVAEVEDLPEQVQRLSAHPQIEAVEASLSYQALGWPDDPLYPSQWNMHTVGAAQGWRMGGGRGVTVAVIDTGVSSVADLQGTLLLDGFSFVPGRASAADDNGHGTHVAGTIAQTTHNGLGAVGLANQARILPLKALAAQGGGQSEWIASAIDEAVDQGADVINLSLGGPRSAVIQVAVDKALARGVLVVAAAGNTGREGVGWPAKADGVIAVSATGPSDTLAPYSSWGEGVELSAPGGDKQQAGGGIVQDTIDAGAEGHAFKELQGTSMASPHVAGAAAVLLGAGAGSAAHTERLLKQGAVDLGEAGPDSRFGHGRLDLAASARILVQQRGLLFLAGSLLAALMVGFGGGSRRLPIAIVAGLSAGGLFFLPLLPLPPSLGLDLLGRPLLAWPTPFVGPRLAANPLWLSALLPALLTFVLGPTRTLGWLAAGLSAGVGAHLIHGAVTGSLAPTWLPASAATAWLGVNGLLCLLFTLAVAGLDRLRRERRS